MDLVRTYAEDLRRALVFKIGRNCLCNFNETQQNFNENEFNMRTKHANIKKHCLDIANTPNDQAKSNPKRTCGINIKSQFSALPTFDVIKQLPQDVMHTLLESAV